MKMKRLLAAGLSAAMVMTMVPVVQAEEATGKLTIWTGATSPEDKARIEEFKEAYPEVDVEFTHYPTEDLKTQARLAVESGTAPDIYYINSGSMFEDFYNAGALMDLTEIVGELGLMERTNPDYLLPYSVDGKIYSFPGAALTTWQALYVNRDLLEQAGITEDPATVSELIDVCNKLNEAGIAPIAFGDKDGWPALLLVGDYFAQQVTDTSIPDAIKAGTDKFTENAEIRKAIETVAQIGQAGAFMPGYISQDHTMAIQTFAAGQTAMLYNGSWWTGTAGGTDLGFNLDVIKLPLIDGLTETSSVQMSSDMAWVISSDTDNLDGAKKFLDFITTEEASIEGAELGAGFSIYPGANEKVQMDPLFKNEAILLQFDKPSLSPFFDWIFPTSVTEVFKVVMQQLCEGEITVDEGLAQLQAEMDNVIAAGN